MSENSNVVRKRITLAMTGASGVQYGIALLAALLKAECEVSLLVSKAALMVIATETNEVWPSNPKVLHTKLVEQFQCDANQLKVYGREDWMSPVASGSGAPHTMVVCPCSAGSLSAIACGASNNLIERAADVAIKEARQLILLIREMPLSAIHLENMLKLSRLGVTIMPAAPGFYHQPQSVADIINFVVARILDHLGIDQHFIKKWGE